MTIRGLATLVVLLVANFLIALVADAIDSEVYFFLPGRHGVSPPPSSGLLYVIMLAGAIGMYFWSARSSAVILSIITAGSYLGLLVGIGPFQWSPGVCQYLIMASLSVTTWFVWSTEYLNVD